MPAIGNSGASTSAEAGSIVSMFRQSTFHPRMCYAVGMAKQAGVAPTVERLYGKEEGAGSTPATSSKRDTKATGDISEAMVIAALLKRGYKVLLPFGEGHRYDLVIDDGGEFIRIQVKTGRLLGNGSINFKASSTHTHRGGGTASYRGQIEYFGVYCADVEQCYLIPVNDVGEAMGYLRVEPTKNNQSAGIRFADDYVL